MARTLLTWRWAASTVLLVAAVVTMLLLGQWQWQRSVPVAEAEVDPRQVDAAALPAVTAVAREPGDGALVPEGSSGELVRVDGTWRADRTLLVADRDRDGVPGSWVVSAVELAGSSGSGGSGGLVPVVQGWVPGPADPAAVTPPSGPAAVVGWVQQSEPLDIPVEVVQPAGVVALLSTADLANRWPEDLVPGFVVAAPTPPQAAAAAQAGLELLDQPPTEQTESRDWRNLAYSAQWVVFAGFAVLLWWRMLRDDVARRDAAVTDLLHPVPSERSTA